MKAVIVEIRRDIAVVLTDDGCVNKVANNQYEIGQVIEMTKVKTSPRKLIACIAGAAAVLAITATTAYAYNTPYMYVSMDVNPSVEFEVNCFDRVIGVTAVNDDGEAILEDLRLENKTITAAIEETTKKIVQEGYIPTAETGGIVISTSSTNEAKADGLAEELRGEAEIIVEEEGLEAEVESESVGKTRVKEAKALGVTPGKLNLVQKLQASAGEEAINMEEWLNKPVKDIMKAIKENKKSDKANKPSKPDKDSKTTVPGETTTTASGDAAETDTSVKGEKKTKNTNPNRTKVKSNNGKDKSTTTTGSDSTETTSPQNVTKSTKPAGGNNKGPKNK